MLMLMGVGVLIKLCNHSLSCYTILTRIFIILLAYISIRSGQFLSLLLATAIIFVPRPLTLYGKLLQRDRLR